AALAFVVSATPSPAQTWPQRPVKFLVTLGPGSGIDIGTRLLADRLSKRWDQPVVVENRPGGDGLVAISAMIAAHDDHVLLASPTSSFTAHPFVYKSLPYKPEDLQPIARVSNTIIVIAVPADLPTKSLADLVALARAEPGKLNWAGTTGAIDFLVAGFFRKAGLNLSKVPYRNQVEAANDLAAGRIQFNETAYAIVRPQLQAGKVKLLAMTNGPTACARPSYPMCRRSRRPAIRTSRSTGWSDFSVRPKCRSRCARASRRTLGRSVPIPRLRRGSTTPGSFPTSAALLNSMPRSSCSARASLPPPRNSASFRPSDCASMNRVEGKAALITGGGAGIGAATGQFICAEGGMAGLVDANPDALAVTMKAIAQRVPGARVSTFAADVADASAAARAVEHALQTFGRLDILVNNAAMRNYSAIADSTPAEWEAMVGVNLIGTANYCKAALPALRRS